jgi:hypothetical protein
VRNQAEYGRTVQQLQIETIATRRRAAAVGIHPLRAVSAYVQDWRSLVAAYRRDVGSSNGSTAIAKRSVEAMPLAKSMPNSLSALPPGP